MEIHPTNKNEVAWTSWMPALIYAIDKTDGPILEIGCGHFSTPMLMALDREVWSVENNREWAEQFYKYRDYRKAVHVAEYDDFIPECAKRKWSVVFIDNSPGGDARLRPFLALLGCSDYLVVHDYHRENETAIKPFLGQISVPHLKHKVFADYDPPTLLVATGSNKI